MKNLSKFDKFMFCGVAFMLILGIFLGCKSCQAEKGLGNLPVIEYGDCEDGIIKCDTIDMYLNMIEGFGYDSYIGKYVIEYDDPDAFDLDHLAEFTDYDEWAYDYLPIECTYNEFIEFIEYYNSIDKSSDEFQFGYNKTYAINEIHYDDGTHKACVFRLIKQ